MAETWRRCSTCKKEIAYGAPIVLCSVSTCNRPRTGMVFCSEPCWDAHVPIMRHRDCWYEEKRAPRTADEAADRAAQSRPAKGASSTTDKPPTELKEAAHVPREVLIVASRLKSYVKDRSEMNTSDKAMSPLSDRVRELCNAAIARAAADARKTVLDRDFMLPPSSEGGEVLIVGSRLKNYIKAKSGLRTSDTVFDPLSDWVRHYAKESIRAAGMDDRKTVLDRDVPTS